jgi:hypothetical protein
MEYYPQPKKATTKNKQTNKETHKLTNIVITCLSLYIKISYKEVKDKKVTLDFEII